MPDGLIGRQPDTIGFWQAFSGLLASVVTPVQFKKILEEYGISIDSYTYRRALEQLHHYWPNINWEIKQELHLA